MSDSVSNLQITPTECIFVAGHRGMAGSAICRALRCSGYGNTYPVDFLLDNLKIQTNLIESAWRTCLCWLLFLGSSCIYRRFAEQPICEDALLISTMEPSNAWWRLQKSPASCFANPCGPCTTLNAISLMPPTSIDMATTTFRNYVPWNSLAEAALIRRFREAAQRPARGAGSNVTCWGSSISSREFLHADDLGEGCMFALERWIPQAPDAPRDRSSSLLTYLNVGTRVELSIAELVRAVAAASGFAGTIKEDTSRPDGTERKLLDVSPLATLGWRARIPLAEGLPEVVASYQAGIAV